MSAKQLFSRTSSETEGEEEEYTLSLSGDRGAFLILGSPATLHSMRHNDSIHEYIHANYADWHAFAVRQGFNVTPKDIVIVSGTVKTTSDWVLGVCKGERVRVDGKLVEREMTVTIPAGSYAQASCGAPKHPSPGHLPPSYMSCRFGPHVMPRTSEASDERVQNNVSSCNFTRSRNVCCSQAFAARRRSEQSAS